MSDSTYSSNILISFTPPSKRLQIKKRIAEMIKYAVVIVASVPVLMIYPFVQKYFVKGVMIGALKG